MKKMYIYIHTPPKAGVMGLIPGFGRLGVGKSFRRIGVKSSLNV